ncbi:unnamed protein product [Acanthoscelides obtectus]|uniref:DUF4817 domain-containing protein n=1 Tax=Acanthoscelides obtectus TaxID=200917 RepID=A0A9P0QET4_ACAOB|nr:unnamed protein product [Acanthoscelides obtectus]CAH2018492.1 unnamed protein product [Acanthoscelides obtectus]CAK1628373.1 hypothetical protein AOBTE_LOCUS5160 [Acanthoscelides obtectus]CAK1628374.1 hypothetical protein AOBTE_LOCUS5161 [Acanthoscelides obtectus]
MSALKHRMTLIFTDRVISLYVFLKRQFTTILVIGNRGSVVLTQRAYRRKYPGKQAPYDNTTRRLVPNFIEYVTVGDRQHTVHQRPRR